MAVYAQDKYITQFSLNIVKCFNELGFEKLTEYEDLRTHKICFVYPRTDEADWFLCMLRVNKELGLNHSNEEIVNFFKRKMIIPDTNIDDYLSRLKYKRDTFDVNNHIKD